MAYTRPEVPPLLRIGANPAFHEGIGELISLAAGQVPYLQAAGILPRDFQEDQTAFLLTSAIAQLGALHILVVRHHDPLGSRRLRERSFARPMECTLVGIREQFQGIEPPSARGEEFCDAATKTHINDNPAYYYSYAIATVLKFQLHDHIARKILHQPPQHCNYAGNKQVGAFLKRYHGKGRHRGLAEGCVRRQAKTYPRAPWWSITTRSPAGWQEQNRGRQIGWE